MSELKLKPLKGPTPPFWAVICHYGIIGTADHDDDFDTLEEASVAWESAPSGYLMAFALHRDDGWIMSPWHSRGVKWGAWEKCSQS